MNKFVLAVFFFLSAMTSASFGQKLLIDDFLGATQESLPGESRAAFPPGTDGGSIVDIVLGTDVATDRGLFGPEADLRVFDGNLEFQVAPGFVEFDWNVEGFDFVDNGLETIIWRGLTNESGGDVSLRLELFQTFDGTGTVVGTGAVDIVLLDGETRDVEFNAIGGETDFAGFRLVNQSNFTFDGTLESVIAVPEPNLVGLLSMAAFAISYRRRKTC